MGQLSGGGMNSLLCPARHVRSLNPRWTLQSTVSSRCGALSAPTWPRRRCFHQSEIQLAEQAELAVKSGEPNIAEQSFWKEYRQTLNIERPNFPWSKNATIDASHIGATKYTAVGYLTSVTTLSETLAFGRIWSGAESESESTILQIICRDPEQCAQLKGIRLHSHLSESVPWILIKETHSNIESGTAPALKAVEVAISVTSLFRNVQKIDGSDTGSEKRLMSITPSGVHEKATLVLSDSLCESLWAFLDDNVSPSLLTWDTGINLLSGIIEELGHNDIALEFGLTNLTLDA